MRIAKLVASGHAKRLKKPPFHIPEHGIVAMKLGTVLEIESLRDFQFRWTKHKPLLCWAKDQKSLVFVDITGRVMGAKEKTDSIPITPEGPGVDLFRGFHGRDAKRITSYALKTKGNQWITFGTVTRIDYFSTKQNKRDSYTHKHGSGVQLYRFGDDSGPTLWVLKGGKLTVTARGIVH